MTDPSRLDALLAGDAPRDDAERELLAFVAALREAQPEASDDLRRRVAATATSPEGAATGAAGRRRWGRLPRSAWAGAAVAGAAALAIAVPLVRDAGSGGSAGSGDAAATAADMRVPGAPGGTAPAGAPESVLAPVAPAPVTVTVTVPPERGAAAVAAAVGALRARGAAVTGGAGRAVPVAGGSRYALRAVMPPQAAVPGAAALGTGAAADARAVRLGRAVVAGDAAAIRSAEARLVRRDAGRAAALGATGTPVRLVFRLRG